MSNLGLQIEKFDGMASPVLGIALACAMGVANARHSFSSPSAFGWHSMRHIRSVLQSVPKVDSTTSVAFTTQASLRIEVEPTDLNTWPVSGISWVNITWSGLGVPEAAAGETRAHSSTEGQQRSFTTTVLTMHCLPTGAASYGGLAFHQAGDWFSIPTDAYEAGRTASRLVRAPCAWVSQLWAVPHTWAIEHEPAGVLTGTASLLARSEPVQLGADTDPSATRLAYGSGAGDMLVTWTSENATAPAYVRWGTTPGGPYSDTVYASSPAITYVPSDMCHAPANTTGIGSYLPPGYFHTVALRLQAGTRYYAVYGQDGGAVAPEITFVTRSAPGPDTPVTLVAFGDSATYPIFPGTVTTFDLILALDAEGNGGTGGGVDMVAMIGDLAYAEGSTLVWSLWSGFSWPVSSSIPFMATVGNHETNTVGVCYSDNAIALQSQWQGPDPVANPYGDDCGGEGAVPTYQRYRSPANDNSTGQGVLWYAVELGSVHFTFYSSEHDMRPGSPQYEWLQADLSSVNRSATPWLVVGVHRPVYNGYNDSDTSIGRGQAALLESLFLQYKVDLVLSGHYHNYFRSLSVKQGLLDPSGLSPVYITAGTGGATYHNETVRPDALEWTGYTDAEWGFGVVEAKNSSALRWTFRANVCGGCIRDEAWILRPERAA